MRIIDWSSDVCSSDLRGHRKAQHAAREFGRVGDREAYRLADEEGHERDVEPTQPQRDDAEQESQERAQDSAEKEPQPGADPVVKLAQRGGVGPDGDEDRKRVVSGKSVSVRVDRGGRGILKKKKAKQTRR